MTADLALSVMRSWHSTSRLSNEAYADMSSIARRAADELGDLVDNAITYSLVTAWLKKQPNVWVNGRDYVIPHAMIVLGEIE